MTRIGTSRRRSVFSVVRKNRIRLCSTRSGRARRAIKNDFDSAEPNLTRAAQAETISTLIGETIYVSTRST